MYGSSPRTWGTRRIEFVDPNKIRFIPTYMGNAVPCSQYPEVSTVHPHVHGERKVRQGSISRCSGSSPRTWGTPCCRSSRCLRARFIPTYMGNAEHSRPAAATNSVHPHVHGERYMRGGGVPAPYGSSPRTWGTLVRKMPPALKLRFIPTYMGNATPR